MASQLLPYVGATIALVAIWAAALFRLDVFTPEDVRAWRRLAALRGFERPPSRFERVAERAAVLRRLQDELDLGRLLAIADRDESPLGFLGQTLFAALLWFTLVLVGDVADRLTQGDFLVPPWIAVLVALSVVLMRLSGLRAAARRRQQRAGQSLGDMMMLVAIMTDGRGLQLDDAVRILSRCTTSRSLETLVDGRGWERLVRVRPRTTVELYEQIAVQYGISEFQHLAEALSNTHVGFSERDTYTRLAQAVYEERLSQARMRSARAKILVTLPVAGMLIPLLLLLGAPTFASITSGLGGG